MTLRLFMKLSKILFLILSFFVLCSNFTPDFGLENKSDQAYITSKDLKTITPIDLETGLTGKPIELEFYPKAIVISEKKQKAFCFEQGQNLIIPIDLHSRTVLETISVPESIKQILISKDEDSAYILMENLNEITLLNLRTARHKSLIALTKTPSQITLNQDGKSLFCAYFGSKEITKIDLETAKLESPIILNAVPITFAVTNDGLIATVLTTTSNQLDFLDIDTGLNLNHQTISFDSNIEKIVLSQDGKRAYVTHENSNSITSINLNDKSADKLFTLDHDVISVALVEKQDLIASFSAKIKPAGYPSIFEARKQSSFLGETIQYVWDFGDGHAVTTDKITKAHTYKKPGEYQVTLTIKENSEPSANSSKKTTLTKKFKIVKGQGILAEFEQMFAPSSVTTTALSSSLNPSVIGQLITLTATITSPDPGTITGTVEFFNGATSLGISTVSGSAASLTTSALTLGSHTLTANYSGDATFFPSNSLPLTQVVAKAATTTALTSSANPSVFGQSVTFTATVSSAYPVALSGSVQFFDGATSIGTSTLASGVATLATSGLTLGSHSITAVYSGDGIFLTSTSSPLTQVIGQAATSTVVASSLNPSRFGQTVTFTATISLTSGAGTPTGTVTFKDGAITIGSGSIVGTTATFATSILSVAVHTITAEYGGDTNFSGSTSPNLTQTVNQGTTSTAVVSSLNPSIFGNSITLTATLNVTAGVGTPTGTVTFRDGATTIGTGTVAAGTVTFATSLLSVGPHSITALYGGDTNFAGSTSLVVTQVVNQGSTSTTVASSFNPSTYGASVTFTSTTVVSIGAGTLTGTVAFFDGVTSLGSSSIGVGGIATLAVSNLTVGSHSITTIFSGDTNFLTSTSPIATQVVNKATPIVTITSSLNPSLFGDSVTFTSVVNSPTALGSPAGTVSFFDGPTLLGIGNLIPTTATSSNTTFTISTLTAGTHPITAVYSGDTNFLTLTSSILNQIITQVTTTQTTIFTNSPNPTLYGQVVLLQVTVRGSVTNPPLPPAGTVIFYDGATVLGSSSLSAVSANVSSALLSVSTLSVGAHTLTASYLGDTNYPTSTSLPMIQNVIKTGTTSVVTSNANPSVFGQNVTFSSAISGMLPGMGQASGSVLFYDGPILLGTGILAPTGPNTSTATFSTSGLSLGSHNIFTIYNGDVNFTSSTSTILNQIVNQDPTTTALTSSLNPSNFGNLVTFTATPTANAPGSGTPTGSVQFFDGAILLGTVNLTAGSASYSTIALYPGSHNITARYSGDINFITSTSAPLIQVVNLQLPTVTTLTSSRNSSPTAQAVTYSARVTAITGEPTGTVTFYDLTNSPLPIGTGTLVNGVATITEPGSSLVLLGIHQIEAVYNGDADFITSTSAIFNQYVVPLDTSTTLVTAPNPSTQESATFTATVAIIGGVGPLTGNVSFYENGVLIPGIVNFNTTTGVATLSPNNLRFGSRLIVAIYSGDLTTFAMSTSNTVIQQVQQTDMLTTNTTLTTSLSSAYYCQPITLTATLTSTQGFYIPTGSVTFFSNNIEVGTSILNSAGVAILPLNRLPVGTTTLRATYNSDSNYAFSFSNQVTQTIISNTTTTVLTIIPNLASTPYTQTLFFSAKINSAFGIATGSVTFYDGTTALETVTLDATGLAFYQTASLTTGAHFINTVYNADPCFITSIANLNHAVTKISPTISYSSTPNPSTYGDDIVLTASLSLEMNGYPSGTITFYNGFTLLGTAILNNGTASYTLKNVPAGVIVIRGTYSGDSKFNATNLPSFIQRIIKANTSTCLNTYSLNPTQYGQIITFNAEVSSTAATPTGNVIFRNGSTIIGTVPLTGCGTATLDSSNVNLGANTITATYVGDTNFNTSTSSSLIQNITQADSKTTVVSSTPNPSVFNGLVTFNVSVTNLGTGIEVPSGTVTGYFGSTVLGTATLSNGLASFTTTALPAGVDTVIIKYSGDANFTISQTTATQTVTTLPTTTFLTSSNNPSVSGQAVTFSATVTSTTGTPTGTIAFLDGTITLATQSLNTSGQASLTLSNLSTATHPIRAVYSGSSNLSGSTSNTISQVVNKAATITTLLSALNPSTFGDNIVFTAFVSATSPGSGIPTGTVTFRNGAATLGTGVLNAAGSATFSISSLAANVTLYSITAVYAGDVNFLTSTSFILSERINKSATITSATATPNPANIGSSVSISVTVAPVTTGTGIPTGTVTALYGSTVVGTATLNGSGQATFSTSSLPPGTLGIVVQYAGDTNYLGSSTPITEKVNQNVSSIILASSLNPSVFQQNVTLTATVTSTSGIPTGTVSFFDGTTALQTVTLNGSAVATFSSRNLSVGSHLITALYNGDVNNLPVTSTVLTQIVNQAPTITTVNSIPNPSMFGNQVTFTALAIESNVNINKPTGTITFKNGAVTLATVNIDTNGRASFATSTLAVGVNSITADYNGDVNYLTSTSIILSQTVNKTDTKISVSATPNPSTAGNSVTFSMTVSPINTTNVFPSGIVNAYNGSTLVGTATLNGVGFGTFSTSALPAGTLGIMFQYVGDTNFNQSTTTFSQTVTQAISTNVLTTSVNPSNFGQNITFTATVTSLFGIPVGTVLFYDGSSIIGGSNLNGSGVASLVVPNLSVGIHPIVAIYSGSSSIAASTSNNINQIVNQTVTTTSITSSLNPSMYLDEVTFTAQVTAVLPGIGIPIGTIIFIDGATVIGTSNVDNLGTATFSTRSLLTGAHSITAVYTDDINFGVSTSPILTQVVIQANTLTTLVSSTPNPSMFGEVVTFFATVTNGFAVPGGSVTFLDGATVLGTVPLSDGLAIFATPILSIGTHPITASYSGNSNFNPSVSSPPYAQVVNQTTITVTTVTTLTSDLNPSNYGDLVTFDVTVTPIAGGGTPTGVVTIYRGSVPLTTLLLVSGQGSYSTSTLPSGNLNIVALYSGDSAYSSSIITIIQVVNPITTTTILTSSLNPSNYLDQVSFTATVTTTNLQIPTGMINFFDGASIIGAALLDSTGSATLTLSNLSTGSHNISAFYPGEQNYLSSSDMLVQIVNPAITSTVILTSTPNPSNLGNSVTFIATTVSTGNNISGMLTFYDGATVIGTVPLYNGLGILSTSILSIGTHSITASFGGDSNFASSVSPPYTQIVQPATLATTTTVVSSNNPSEVGEAVVLTASIIAVSGTPTGTVSFYDGSTSIGTVVLNSSGIASLSTTSLSEGSHSITAIYSGDFNYGGSSSSILTQLVGQSSIPGIPQNFHGCQIPNKFLNVSSFKIRLTWSSPQNGLPPTGYRIYSNQNLTKLVGEVPANQLAFEVLNVKKNKTYQYYIVAVNGSLVSNRAATIVYPKNQPCRAGGSFDADDLN